MSLITGQWKILGTMAFAYIPAFSLPFALASSVADRQISDVLLLAISTAITVGSVLGLAHENAWASWAAAVAAAGNELPSHCLKSGMKKAAVTSSIVTLFLLPAFAASYFFGDVRRQLLILCMLAVMPFPIFSGVASVSSGILNAHGRVPLNLLLQGVRGIFPLAGVGLVFAGRPIWTVGVLLSLGEMTRVLLSGRAALQYAQKSVSKVVEVPSTRAIVHHVGGLALLGASPIIDRSFFAASGVGNVTRFEMADRVFFAGNQVGNNLLILPRVSLVAQKLREKGLRQVVREENRLLYVLSGAGSLIGVLGVLLALPFLTASTRGVALWSATLLLSLPASLAGTSSTRLLVASGNSRLIPWLCIVGVTLNIALNIIGSVTMGPYGVVVSTVVVRYVLLVLTNACLYWADPQQTRTRLKGLQA